MLYLPQACLPEKVGHSLLTQCFTELFFNTLLLCGVRDMPYTIWGTDVMSMWRVWFRSRQVGEARAAILWCRRPSQLLSG